jgi:hypothetical protein
MTSRDVRRHLVEALEADLMGPFVPDGQEILPIAPSRWYLTGFLAPQGGRVPDTDDRDSEPGELAAGRPAPRKTGDHPVTRCWSVRA